MAKLKCGRRVSAYKPILLKQDIGRDVLAAVEVRKFDLPGVIVNVKPRRHSLYKQGAAHLIGYLGEINMDELKSEKYPGCRQGDFVGKFGVERAFEPFLRGQRGGRQVEVNAAGQVVEVLKTVGARPGNNIYLTIDQALQQKAEMLLKDLAGAVIAMDPKTGQILALASSPASGAMAMASGRRTIRSRGTTTEYSGCKSDQAIATSARPTTTSISSWGFSK